MLQIGERCYQLVRAQSGFHVTVDATETGMWRQTWRFDAHYVPADVDPGPRPEAGREYWRLAINPMNLAVADWRQLAEYNAREDGGEGFHPFSASLENLLHEWNDDKGVRTIFPGEFRVLRRDGYLFACEFDGEIKAAVSDAEAIVGEFGLLEEVPFATVTVRVPINAADPVASARAIAAREIGLTSIGRTHVQPYDPARKRHSRFLGTDKHSVLLETPWRSEV